MGAEAALAGRVAVVTGASRGIGRAIAVELARRGATLALCARDEAALAETARLAGGRVLAARCDLAEAEDIGRFAARVERELGAPEVLVHNAGAIARARVDELEVPDWDRVLDVNLKAPFLLTRALLPGMRVRRSGRIIFIASISATLGTPRLAAYCASKHGLIGLMRSLAEELRDEGLLSFAINPGSVDTDMLKGSGFDPDMTPQEIAGVAAWLATSAPAAMTGSSVDVFG